MALIGIDLGGHTITAASVKPSALPAIVQRVSEPTPASRTVSDTVRCMALMVRRLVESDKKVLVGVSVPGFIDSDRRKVLKLTNFDAQPNINLSLQLKKKLSEMSLASEVLIENDANCAAVGEGICGLAAGCGDYVVLTLGTGIGAGIISGGKLIRGAHGMAGEAGHMVVTGEPVKCRCGGRGHLESISSADYAEKTAEAVGLRNVDFKGIWSGRNEDRVCRMVAERVVDSLARGVTSVVSLLDPEMIVLNGGMSRAEGIAEAIRARAMDYIPDTQKKTLRIEVSKIGADAAIYGAASLFDAGTPTN